MSRGIGTIVFVCQVLVILEGCGVEHKDVRDAASAQWVFLYPSRTRSDAGDFAEVRRTYNVRPSERYTLRVAVGDSYLGATAGYHFKQVLLDGEVVWEQDVAGGEARMQPIEVDVTKQVIGKSSVTVALRAIDRRGVRSFGVRVVCSEVEAEGLAPAEGAAWTASAVGRWQALQAASLGTISGVVTDRADGSPWAGVTIRVEDQAGKAWGWARTGADGRYRVWVLPGTYRISVAYAEGVDPVEVVVEKRQQVQDVDFAPAIIRSPIGVTLPARWRYHAGDNTAWASPEFDDSSWERVDPRLPSNQLPRDGWKGIGWFRMHVTVDSTLWNTPLALEMNQKGASEIYLDGRLLYTFGKVGTAKTEEEPYREYNPKVISFGRETDHLIAVRYSNFSTNAFHERGKFAGFDIGLFDLNSSIVTRVDGLKRWTRYYTIIEVILWSFAVLHFLLFLFYPRSRENLYYAILLSCFANILLWSNWALFPADPAQGLRFQNILIVFLALSATAIVRFAYSLFYAKLPRQFWAFLMVGVSLVMWDWFAPFSLDVRNLLVMLNALVAFVETLRVIVVAILRKKAGALTISIGLTAFCLSAVFDYVPSLPLMLVLGFPCLILSMSIHLARNLAQTSKNLESQLIETKELSEKVLEQERRIRDEEIQRALLEGELQTAHDMQMGLLPEAAPQIQGVDLSGICIPANHVGGDYYQFVHLDETRTKLGIVLADVSGHAMQAATVAMRFSEMLRYEIEGQTEPAEILKGLDASLRGHIPPEMFVTCGVGVLDVRRMSLTFASAANPEVYRFSKRDGNVAPLRLTGLPLGLPLILQEQDPFQSADLGLESGDVLVFASDGVEEAQDGREGFYEGERLCAAIQSSVCQYASAEEIRDEIIADVRQFMGDASQIDDITVVVLRAV